LWDGLTERLWSLQPKPWTYARTRLVKPGIGLELCQLLAIAINTEVVIGSPVGSSLLEVLFRHMLRHGTGFYLANQGHDTRAI
jgi:hypothetical protein